MTVALANSSIFWKVRAIPLLAIRSGVYPPCYLPPASQRLHWLIDATDQIKDGCFARSVRTIIEKISFFSTGEAYIINRFQAAKADA